MQLLTKWMSWFVYGRSEHKFHCDLLLAPGEFVEEECEQLYCR